MPRVAPPPKPRKSPVQARSKHTVEAIHDASIQVLLAGGLDRLTTTRVAERAGVSVGSLYQYYPDKRSLLAAVLERHLSRVVDAVERACVAARGGRLDAIARAVVDAFVDAKLADAPTSAALYAVAAEVDGAAVVERLSRRTQQVLAETLASARDRRPTDAPLASYIVSTAVIGPVQGLLAAGPTRARATAVRGELAAMVGAYLRATSVRVPVLEPARGG